MKLTQKFGKASVLSLAISTLVSPLAHAQNDIEEVTILGSATYVFSLVTDSMIDQQSSITSINSVIDNLPGVSIQEGDVYGFDDWSTSITIRGFSTNLGEQQIGTTIDGIPNGGSNYGGGAKANRYLDPSNLGGVEVSQGTSDIASASLEALGGTINYLTSDPEDDQRIRLGVAVGDFDAQRFSLRYDSGLINDATSYWLSFSTQEASDWVAESAENERDHFAAKVKSSVGSTDLTAYISYDDTHEDNYQRVYSEAQFDQFPDSDGLTAEWTGVPFEDQLFRRGWSTLRENLLAYVKADFNFSEELTLSTSLYHHQNEGRGDWLPPYLINATDDGTSGNSEFLGGTTALGISGGGSGDRILFVDSVTGAVVAPLAGCTGTYTVTNWYGSAEATAPAAADPSCYPQSAVAVQSFRNTHYEKDRTGLIADLSWNAMLGEFDNEVRAGLWYEDQTRDEYRDWHNVDTTAGFVVDSQPYWIQYDRSYPTQTTRVYVQDNLTAGAFTFSLGAKKFMVDLEREDRFDSSLNAELSSDSDMLFSGGVVWNTGVDGLEAFVGYAENFKALSDLILERPNADFNRIEPETSETIELGVRYDLDRLTASAVYFQNDFENRLFFVSPITDDDDLTGINFEIGTNGTFINAGGIESSGLELSANYDLSDLFSIYASYTWNDAEYLGTGSDDLDEIAGIAEGNEVAGIPESIFVASFDYRGDLAYAGVSVKHTSDRFVNTSNTWVADAYTLTDIYAGLRFDNLGNAFSSLNIHLTLNNAFDEDYLGTIAENAAWIGGKRTWVLGATVDF